MTLCADCLTVYDFCADCLTVYDFCADCLTVYDFCADCLTVYDFCADYLTAVFNVFSEMVLLRSPEQSKEGLLPWQLKIRHRQLQGCYGNQLRESLILKPVWKIETSISK